MSDPDPVAFPDVLWLGANAPDGSLRTAEGDQRRGTAVSSWDVPAGLALADGGPGVALVVLDLRSELAPGLLEGEVICAVLDAVAPAGAVRLVAEGAEQTGLLVQLLERWPAGWSFEHVGTERGAVSATVRRAAAGAVVDHRSAAGQLWTALDRLARALSVRDHEARVTAQRLALRDLQLEAAVERETEGLAREHELLDEITQLRALVKLERRARRQLRDRVRAEEAARSIPARPVRLHRRALRRARALLRGT